MLRTRWALLVGLLLGMAAVQAQGPLTPIALLRGTTDSNGYLRVALGTYGGADGPLTPIGQLRGTTDSNGYLLVSLGSGSAPLTVGTTTITSGTDGRILYDNAGVLGELATTGSGNVVRATSPTLVTPALGTPASGVLTNATGLPLTTGVTGILPVANGGTNNAFFTVSGPATSAKTYTFPNASSTVLTDNAAVTVTQGGHGSAPASDDQVFVSDSSSAGTWRTVPNCTDSSGNHLNYTQSSNTFSCGTSSGAASFTPTITVATDFEGQAAGTLSSRFTVTNTGTGAATGNVVGLNLTTGATGTSGTSVAWQVSVQGNSGNPSSGSPSMGMMLEAGPTFGTDFTSFFGLGNLAATGGVISYTPNHIGFKITRAASGTTSLYATQGDGTAETASSALTTLTAADDLALAFKVNGTASVDYYYSVNQGAWSSATNLTGNMPTVAANWSGTSGQFIVSNSAVASTTTLRLYGATFTR